MLPEAPVLSQESGVQSTHNCREEGSKTQGPVDGGVDAQSTAHPHVGISFDYKEDGILTHG